MKEEHRIKLAALSEKLTEVLISEIDPDNWAGASSSAEFPMSREERGNRVWDKKSAAMTLMLVKDISNLAANTKESLGRDPLDDGEMDARINRANAQAAQLLDKVTAAAKKTEFKKRVKA